MLDLPGWQVLQDELADQNFQVIAVAIDEAVDTIKDYIATTDGISYPVLIDADHVVAELYAISNVPTVVLIDEHDRIVQPNWNAYATNTFKEFHGIDADGQLDASVIGSPPETPSSTRLRQPPRSTRIPLKKNRPACTSGWPTICAVAATPKAPSATSNVRGTSPLTIGRSGERHCHYAAEIHSVLSSSSCSKSSTRLGGRTTE